MKGTTVLAASLAAALGWGEAAFAEQARRSPATTAWDGEHALTIEPHRLELGVFGGAHYGFGRTQVSLHPALFFVLPHLEVKRRIEGSPGDSALAWRARVSYPSAALRLISREGAGGLLPQTTSPPPALLLEGDLLSTWIGHDGLGRGFVSAGLGLAVAAHPRFSNSELPLLDFPFLYQRFAALYTPVVPRFFIGVEGPIFHRQLFVMASARYYLMPDMPDVGAAAALEQHIGVEYRFNRRVAVALDMKSSLAKYAYATRAHLLPYADVRVGF